MPVQPHGRRMARGWQWMGSSASIGGWQAARRRRLCLVASGHQLGHLAQAGRLVQQGELVRQQQQRPALHVHAVPAQRLPQLQRAGAGLHVHDAHAVGLACVQLLVQVGQHHLILLCATAECDANRCRWRDTQPAI